MIHFDGFVDGPAFLMRWSCFAIDADVPMDSVGGSVGGGGGASFGSGSRGIKEDSYRCSSLLSS